MGSKIFQILDILGPGNVAPGICSTHPKILALKHLQLDWIWRTHTFGHDCKGGLTKESEV